MMKRPFTVQMNRRQIIAGLLYLPFYLILLSLGLELLLWALLGRQPTPGQLNACFYAVNAVVVLLIFGRFLREDLSHTCWRAVLRGLPKWLLIYYGLSFAVSAVVLGLQPDFVNQNNDSLMGIMEDSPVFILVLTVIMAPVIEELLFRGLIFGALRRVSRVLAYAVTALGFAAIHVMGYFGTLSLLEIVLSILQYVPAAVTLGAIYERYDTIAAPMLLHACINLIACLLMGAML